MGFVDFSRERKVGGVDWCRAGRGRSGLERSGDGAENRVGTGRRSGWSGCNRIGSGWSGARRVGWDLGRVLWDGGGVVADTSY